MVKKLPTSQPTRRQSKAPPRAPEPHMPQHVGSIPQHEKRLRLVPNVQTPEPARASAAQAVQETHAATVIWFNRFKGFGMVRLDDGRDAFIDGSVLGGDVWGTNVQRPVDPGDKIETMVEPCDLFQGQVTLRVTSVKFSQHPPIKKVGQENPNTQGSTNGTARANPGKRRNGSCKEILSQVASAVQKNSSQAPGRGISNRPADNDERCGLGTQGHIRDGAQAQTNGSGDGRTGKPACESSDRIIVRACKMTFDFGMPPLSNSHIENVVSSLWKKTRGRHPSDDEWQEIRLAISNKMLSWARARLKKRCDPQSVAAQQ